MTSILNFDYDDRLPRVRAELTVLKCDTRAFKLREESGFAKEGVRHHLEISRDSYADGRSMARLRAAGADRRSS